MGNLSCVSCKVKEKGTEKSIGELPQSANKRTVLSTDSVQIECVNTDREPNKEGVRFVDSTEKSNYHRTTAQELYDTLKSQRLKDDEDNNLDDVEKAAKAIVDMTVFLTTQVIYPAYLTYLRQDHPEIYKQYFEQENKVMPFDNGITVNGEQR